MDTISTTGRGDAAHLAPGDPQRRAGITRAGIIQRAVLAGGALSAWALAGCETVVGGPQARTQAPVTLVYTSDVVAGTAPEGKTRLDIIEEFNRTNSWNITVNLDQAQTAMRPEKLKVLVAGGTPPDISGIYFTEGPEMFVAGATVELESLLKKDKEWGKQRADMFPGILDGAVWGGKLTSLPMYQNITAFVYNPKLLTKVGVPFPAAGWTWNDFKAAAQRASDPPRSWGLSFKWNMGHFSAWVGGLGAGLVSPDRRKMTVTSPECLEATEFIVGLIKASVTSPTSNQELFRKGTDEAVFELQGPFRMGVFRQAGIEFGVVHHPVHPTKRVVSAFSDGKDAVIYKATANQDAAARVLVWLNGPHAQGLMGAAGVAMPISKAGNATQELVAYLKTDPQFKVFVDTAPSVRAPRFPAMPSYTAMNRAIDAGIAEIYLQKVGARDGLAQLARATQQILDEDLKTVK